MLYSITGATEVTDVDMFYSMKADTEVIYMNTLYPITAAAEIMLHPVTVVAEVLMWICYIYSAAIEIIDVDVSYPISSY